MSKHTPGPWWLKVAHNGDCGILAYDTGVFAEAYADIRHSGEDNRDEALANARLIAAAPDLLEALKAINVDICMVSASSENMRLVRDAIAKAEGVVAPTPSSSSIQEKSDD